MSCDSGNNQIDRQKFMDDDLTDQTSVTESKPFSSIDETIEMKQVSHHSLRTVLLKRFYGCNDSFSNSVTHHFIGLARFYIEHSPFGLMLRLGLLCSLSLSLYR